MEVLALKKSVLGDTVIKVLPQGDHGMPNVASPSVSRDSLYTCGTGPLEVTYLIVIKPTPAKMPMTANSCQNSRFRMSAQPRISTW